MKRVKKDKSIFSNKESSKIDDSVKVGKWNIPKRLFEQYILWQTRADGYISGTLKTPSGLEQEKVMRWQFSVQRVMEIHREICQVVDVEYSSDEEDEFYIAFKKEVRKQTRLKGSKEMVKWERKKK